jgi:small subunit ribosomal protein S15
MKPELVRRYVSSEHFNARERAKAERAQIAQLSHKISHLTEHFKARRKDVHSRMGLQRMLERRKKLMRYLRRTNGDSYGDVIFRLGLKDPKTNDPAGGKYAYRDEQIRARLRKKGKK